ncbi:MAG: hypothetical protein A2075_02405 [Geobacteraceae bacterium GWC2_58_44]|nr:MAG: hypothetical protein A2075_02405 [Geobacteraceae bacterium GWC2_58_44]
MLSYLVHFIHAFIPVSLMTGMLLALWTPVRGPKTVRPVLVSLAAGLLVGAVAYPVSVRMETLTAARTFLFGAAILAALGNAAALFVSDNRSGALSLVKWGGALFVTAALAAVTSFTFLVHVAEQALSAVTVLNTELILNIGGVLAGFTLIALLIPLTAHLGMKNGGRILSGILLLASLLLCVQWSADVLLGLMRLELIELTSIRLSFVAKVTKYLYILPYLQALLIAALALGFFVRRPAVAAAELAQMQKAERRKARSLVIREMRWFKAALACVGVIFAVCLYFDLYASRPVKISPPTMLTPDAAGLIKIGVDRVKDGKLHRYAIVTDDGHVVRFFLINRSMGLGSKIGVVYDACMLCGDMGYIQEKNEVICIACNVRIFLPSIGKAGGCNPIPLEHKIEADQVLLSVEELDKGAKYFTEVVSRKVKDPVTGKELENTKAPFRHEYKGRTYFFESEESGEKFQKSPESYVGEQQSRYYRVQGFQGS